MGTIPTPGTQGAGAVVTSTLLLGFRDVMNFWASPPGCSARQSSTATTLTTAIYTTLGLDSESFDNVQSGDSPMHDNVTNNSRITIRTAGKYLVSGQVTFVANATGVRKVYIQVNASATVTSIATTPAVSGTTTSLACGPQIVPLSVGDYLEIVGYQSSGGNLATDTSLGATYLTALLIAA